MLLKRKIPENTLALNEYTLIFKKKNQLSKEDKRIDV